MLRRCCAALLLCLALPAAAEEAKPTYANMLPFLQAAVGARACYTRTYDAAHLAAHPKQRVTAMTFFLRVIGVDFAAGGAWVLDPKAKYDKLDYQFAMSVTRRGEKPIGTTGYCPDEVPNALCIRECDGGGVTLEKVAGADALIVRLQEDGILMGDCDERTGKWLKPGSDDKSFRLEKVALEQCRALEKGVLDK